MAILRWQDPTDPDGLNLLETLVAQAVIGRGAFAAYAWATKSGLDLVFRDGVFERFLERYSFDLVIGVDAVTTPAALEELATLCADYDGQFSASVFLDTDGHLFHPKVACFREQRGGTLVAGSGNLTSGGLTSNYEAFTSVTLGQNDLAEIEGTYDDWRAAHQDCFKQLDDREVLERAERNARRMRSGPAAAGAPATDQDEADALGRVSVIGQILVAEIPRSGDRWKQANFTRELYEGFFGAQVGTQRRVLFQHHSPVDGFGPIESRPTVEVASHNWRFELDAATGLAYPDANDGRPIGVFVPLAKRKFIYRLVMPGSPAHRALAQTLSDAGAERAVRRILLDVDQARTVDPVADLMARAPAAYQDHDFG